MLYLSGFELYSRWVPLTREKTRSDGRDIKSFHKSAVFKRTMHLRTN